MGEARVQRLIEAVANEVATEIKEKFEAARREGNRRLEAAAGRIRAEAAGRLESLKRDAEKKKGERIVAAKAEADKGLLLLEKEIMDEFLRRLESRLPELRLDPRYPAALQRYIVEGAEALGVDELEVIVSPRDRGIITEEFLRATEGMVKGEVGWRVHLTLAEDDVMDIDGGVIVREKGTGLMYNNSLRRRLERMRRQINHYIDHVFFEPMI